MAASGPSGRPGWTEPMGRPGDRHRPPNCYAVAAGALYADPVTGWVPDVLPGYWQRTVPLGSDPDGEGEIAATLIRRGQTTGFDRAVLAIHGYTDYFFHTELADHFAGRGFGFYALDLRKCGRSRQPSQTPHFTTDLAFYDAELEHALSV